MARQTSAAPVVADLDALDEFMEVLRDYAPTIEHDVIRLRREPGEPELIRSLFRTLHNIKGDAGLCKVDLAVGMVHPLETVLDRVRS
ncbi:Hpt domain-containing protein, partial [Accumulibacter sp.]|uniref:Hpt domain-containing protein n=1 Tax=Accumulibacter sp. TaxID=2053492 RepID=UPI0028C39957